MATSAYHPTNRNHQLAQGSHRCGDRPGDVPQLQAEGAVGCGGSRLIWRGC